MDYDNRKLSIGDVCETAWDLAKKHWMWLVLLYIVNQMCSSLFTASRQAKSYDVLNRILQGDMDGAVTMQKAIENAPYTVSDIAGWFLAVLLSLFITMVTFRYLRGAVRGGIVDLTGIIKTSVGTYHLFLIKMLVLSIVLVAAYCCFILPGIYFMVRLMFVPYIAANEPELSLGETFSKSMDLTRGRFWQLLGYGIVAMLIDLVGICVFFVGYLYTQAITKLMLAHVYSLLSGDYEKTESATLEE